MDVVLGSKKGFVVTKGSGHGIAYQCSEPIVIPLSYPGTPRVSCILLCLTTSASLNRTEQFKVC